MVLPTGTNVDAAPDEGPNVIISFDAAEQAPYVMEATTDVVAETFWKPITNFPAGQARTETVTVETTGERRYFRLVSTATNSISRPMLQIAREQTFTTNSIVIPAGTDNTFGNVYTSFFSAGGVYQSFFSRSNFLSANGDQLKIIGIAFRVDEKTSQFDVTGAKIQIWLSTFTNAVLSAFQNENWGSDHTRVYSRKGTHFQALSAPSDPSVFQIELHFDEPFSYDRTKGDFLMEFWGGEGGSLQSVDAEVRQDESFATIVSGSIPILPYVRILKVFYISEQNN